MDEIPELCDLCNYGNCESIQLNKNVIPKSIPPYKKFGADKI